MTVTSCQGGSEVARSASGFCDAWMSLAGEVDEEPDAFATVESASPDQLRELARHAPDDSLRRALETIAELQPSVVEQMGDFDSGRSTPEDIDLESMRDFSAAGRTIFSAWSRLCQES